MFTLLFTLFHVITARNSSFGKVMFSQACVKNSVHGGGVHPYADAPWADNPPTQTQPPR